MILEILIWHAFIEYLWTESESTYLFFLIKDFIYLFIYLFIFFRERVREGEREGEKYQCVVVSHTSPTGDLACSPCMCPDWEQNWRPIASQSDTQSTEPHQPGQYLPF